MTHTVSRHSLCCYLRLCYLLRKHFVVLWRISKWERMSLPLLPLSKYCFPSSFLTPPLLFSVSSRYYKKSSPYSLCSFENIAKMHRKKGKTRLKALQKSRNHFRGAFLFCQKLSFSEKTVNFALSPLFSLSLFLFFLPVIGLAGWSSVRLHKQRSPGSCYKYVYQTLV